MGVELKLKYVVESRPEQISGVTESQPLEEEVTYYYDLELDDSNNIIGGEWYQKAHPDLMWKPIVKRPVVFGEPSFEVWSGIMPIPFDISAFAKTSAKTNQPINAILETLISLSHAQ